MGKLRRERAVVSALSAILLATSLMADIRAAEPTAPPEAQPEADPAWRSDGARVVEREAVTLGIPSEGGAPLAGVALDPSVGLRGRPMIEGLPADMTPAEPTELAGWRTERSRSILNPDGTITAEYSAGRLNYLDPNGAWQPLDLSLVAADGAIGAFDVAVAASDREVQFTTTDVASALAELRTGTVSLVIRPLDYAGVLAPLPPVDVVPEPEPSPAPSEGAAPSPSPSAPPSSPPSPAPPASPEGSPAAAATPEPSGSSSPSPGPSSPPSPGTSAAPTPSGSPSVEPSPSPVASPSAEPTPGPIDGVPAWVYEENLVAFAGAPGQGRLVARPTDTGFEFSVVLESASEESTYAFAIDTGGLAASLEPDGRTIRFEEAGFSEGAFSDRASRATPLELTSWCVETSPRSRPA